MTRTNNYNLKKPEPNDPLRVADFNENADILDGLLNSLNTAVGSKAEQSAITALSQKCDAAYSAGNLPWEVGIISLSGMEDGAVAKTFDFTPSAILLGVNGANSGFAVNGKSTCIKDLTSSAKHELTLNGNTLIIDNYTSGLSSALQYLALK